MEFLNIPSQIEVFHLLLKTLERKLDNMGANLDKVQETQENLLRIVQHTHSVVSEVEQNMDKVCSKMDKLFEKSHNSFEQFAMCAKAFYQVRDACHVLREDLGTACGQLVEQSWLDEDALLT